MREGISKKIGEDIISQVAWGRSDIQENIWVAVVYILSNVNQEVNNGVLRVTSKGCVNQILIFSFLGATLEVN